MKFCQGILIFFSCVLACPTYGMSIPAAKRLKLLLQSEMSGDRKSKMPILLPCCYDGLTARLVARAGFEATFMTGFGVSAANGYPDTQLISYGEMQSAASTVSEALCSTAMEMGKEPIPCIADGDTGYGNAINVKRVSNVCRGGNYLSTTNIEASLY